MRISFSLYICSLKKSIEYENNNFTTIFLNFNDSLSVCILINTETYTAKIFIFFTV